MSLLASLSGIHTAIVTPFREGQLDEDAFEWLCENQVDVGAGIVVGSDVGEGLTLEETELLRLVQIASALSFDRVSVIPYIDLSVHRNSDEFARLLMRRGASTIICRLPSSSMFGEEEAYACLRRLCHAIDRPIFFEQKTINDRAILSEGKIATLYEAGLIQGLVLRELDPARFASRLATLGDEFIQLIDDDRLAACHIAAGGQGWITAAGNVAPNACAQLLSTWNISDVSQFRAVRDVLSSASGALNAAHPAIGLKAVLKHSGISDGTVRSPLRCLHADAEHSLLRALNALQSLDRVARRGRD